MDEINENFLFFDGDWGWGLGIGDWGFEIGYNLQYHIYNFQNPNLKKI